MTKETSRKLYASGRVVWPLRLEGRHYVDVSYWYLSIDAPVSVMLSGRSNQRMNNPFPSRAQITEMNGKIYCIRISSVYPYINTIWIESQTRNIKMDYGDTQGNI